MGGSKKQRQLEAGQSSSSSSSSSSSTTLGAAPSAQPWAMSYRPGFSQAPDNIKELAVSIAVADANEVVWLRAIQALTPKDLGLPDNAQLMAARFKALMVLQAHELYDARKDWKNKYMKVYAPILGKMMGMGVFNLLLDEKNIAGQAKDEYTRLQREKRDKARESGAIEIYDPSSEDYKKGQSRYITKALFNAYLMEPLLNFLTLQSELFLPIDAGTNQRVIDSVKGAVDEMFSLLGEDDDKNKANRIQATYTQYVVAEMLQQAIVLQGNAFNHETLADDLQSLSSVNVSWYCEKCGLNQAETQSITKLHADYLSFYESFQDHCKDSVSHAKRIAQNFTEQQYSNCYKHAFEALRKNPGLYVDNFLLELLLQQKRHPNLQADLSREFADIYLPVANKFYAANGQPQRRVADYSQMLISLNPVPASLKETVAQAYAILHTADQKLLSNDAMQSWGNGVDQSTTQQPIVPVNATTALMAQSTQPLFAVGASISDALSQEDTRALGRELAYLPKFTSVFKGFPTDTFYNPQSENHLERPQAVETFRRHLKNATSVDEIACLLTVAKPYINRHRNPLRDYIFNVNHTDIWKTCMNEARLKGLQLLSNTMASSNPPTENTLLTYRREGLFSTHRHESIFRGAWGRTGAQRQIDGMLTTVRAKNLPKK